MNSYKAHNKTLSKNSPTKLATSRGSYLDISILATIPTTTCAILNCFLLVEHISEILRPGKCKKKIKYRKQIAH